MIVMLQSTVPKATVDKFYVALTTLDSLYQVAQDKYKMIAGEDELHSVELFKHLEIGTQELWTSLHQFSSSQDRVTLSEWMFCMKHMVQQKEENEGTDKGRQWLEDLLFDTLAASRLVHRLPHTGDTPTKAAEGARDPSLPDSTEQNLDLLSNLSTSVLQSKQSEVEAARSRRRVLTKLGGSVFRAAAEGAEGSG